MAEANNYVSVLSNLLYIYKRNGSDYWKSVRLSKRALKSSSIAEVCFGGDHRPHLEVIIGGKRIVGLLDSGASISCLGGDAAKKISDWELPFKPINTSVKTASGAEQKVMGYSDVIVSYGEKRRLIRLYVVPSLTLDLYLGIDFWNEFGLVPMQIDELEADHECDKLDENPEKPRMHSLTTEQLEKLELVKKCFPSFETEGLGKTSLIQHIITTTETRPIKQRHYPVSPPIQERMYAELDRMLALGVIEESQSPWNSPVVLTKKSNGKARLCLDSRALNEVTKKDAYPMPTIEGILSRLGETHFISSIDLKDAFWQIELEEGSREETAFSVPGRPLYQYRRMPFGLCNAAQTMCRLIDRVIDHELRQFTFVFIDDLLIISADFETHLARFRRIAERLKSANLTINVDKSHFCMIEVSYLGYIVGNGTLSTDPNKVKAIIDFPVPRTVKQVRSFLGMTGWYRRFVANYADVSAPITSLLQKNKTFTWTTEAEEAFKVLKTALTTAPILTHPDFTKPFVIQCDASSSGVGSVLYQIGGDNEEHPIAYFSKKLNSAQRNYSVTELECLAAVLSVKKFRQYVEGSRFTIVTDHASLKWLMVQKDLSGRLARWSLKLQGFDFAIEHRKGSANVVPDALSRVYMDELNGDETTGDAILDAENFTDDDYCALVKRINDNIDRTPGLQIRDNRVFINTGPGEVKWKLWIPDSLTVAVIKNAHDHVLASHCGTAKTLETVQRMYFWPRMVAQIKQYVADCSVCKETKAPNHTLRPQMGQQIKVEHPWQFIYTDLLGPYPRSKAGNSSLLIVMDKFSKYVLLKPLRKATAGEITRYIENEVFHVYGVPESILSDNGVQYRSNIFKNLLSTYGVKHIQTATHSPQVNASERVNRSILAAIRAYVGSDQSNWDANISSIASSLRNRKHDSTGYSPYYLLFGQHFVNHGSIHGLLRQLNELPVSSTQILPPADFREAVREDVRCNLEAAHKRHEDTYNTRCKPTNFRSGQEVFVRAFNQSNFAQGHNAKLAKQWIPARIISKVGSALYTLEDRQGKTLTMTYHAKDIRI